MIEKFRKSHPEYDDMDTPELCDCLHRKFYSDIPKEEFDLKFVGRPTHDDLETAAVRGKDSLELQDIDGTVKPAVKMTLKEFQKAEIQPEKPFLSLGNGTVYVFAKDTPEIQNHLNQILSGNDSEALGYPSPGPCDCCVTRDGEVITDYPSMHHHAQKGNVMWAASGEMEPLMEKAQGIAAAVKQKGRG